MKRPLWLWLIALVIAAAPALSDVCRGDCERERPPECPLHQPIPRTCSHNHTIGSATLTPTSTSAQPLTVTAAVVAPSGASLALVALDLLGVDCPHVPPLRSPRIDVLRI